MNDEMKKHWEYQIRSIREARRNPKDIKSFKELEMFIEGESNALNFCDKVNLSGDSEGLNTLQVIQAVGGEPDLKDILKNVFSIVKKLNAENLGK